MAALSPPQPLQSLPQEPLPTPRALLTNLLTAIANIPLLPEPETNPRPHPESDGKSGSSSSSNPLRRVPDSHKQLIITLHVLFPGMVLPALDLLERGGVAGVTLLGNEDGKPGEAGGGGTGEYGRGAVGEVGTERRRLGVGDGEGRNGRGGGDGEGESGGGGGWEGGGGVARKGNDNGFKTSSENTFYLVSSSAALTSDREQRHRRRRKSGVAESEGTTRKYIVRLDAWHCTCAAFAFDAATASTGGHHQTLDALGPGIWGSVQEGLLQASEGEEGKEERRMEWSLGGMSLDGLQEGAVPVCKHLLACLLAERWSAALGRYVVEQKVGREEMAGIVADV